MRVWYTIWQARMMPRVWSRPIVPEECAAARTMERSLCRNERQNASASGNLHLRRRCAWLALPLLGGVQYCRGDLTSIILPMVPYGAHQ